MDAVTRITHAATNLSDPRGLDSVIDAASRCRFVLLGEASHGTHEFYATRAEISRRLIEEHGFHAVVAEADWPDAYRVNRFVRGLGDDRDAVEALEGFKRFPTWMWRNTDVVQFVSWMRHHNSGLKLLRQAGFYGMDLYSMFASIQEVLNYLQKVDPPAAKRAKYRYACFDHAAEDAQVYGYAAGFDIDKSCEDQVIQQLVDLRQHAIDYARRDGLLAEDEYFFAEQNAKLVLDAEQYYRSMFHGRINSWNLRDQHMVQTLDALAAHLDSRVGQCKLIVWAHNSHLGDARATEMGERGELNVGQLVRQKWGEQAFLVGFTTHAGTVTAASEWDGAAEHKAVRRSLVGSYERLFHDTGIDRFSLILKDHPELREELSLPRIERAIGVIYLPETERLSHYFYARLPEQFDAVIHFDHSNAVEPLEPVAAHAIEPPETYPTNY